MSDSLLVDARGLSCPQPVLMFHDAVKASPDGPLAVLVDNDASRENVSRAARTKGFAVAVSEEADGSYRIELKK